MVTLVEQSVQLAWRQEAAEIDFGLFVRPFTATSWVCTFLLAFLALLWDGLPLDRCGAVLSVEVASATGGLFFLLITSFYDGALTMFFAVPSVVQFRDVKEAIGAEPEWKFIFHKPNFFYISVPAQTDPVYAEYWAEAKNKMDELTYGLTKEGLQMLQATPRVRLNLCQGPSLISFFFSLIRTYTARHALRIRPPRRQPPEAPRTLRRPLLLPEALEPPSGNPPPEELAADAAHPPERQPRQGHGTGPQAEGQVGGDA